MSVVSLILSVFIHQSKDKLFSGLDNTEELEG